MKKLTSLSSNFYGDHYYLVKEDQINFFHEYTANKTYNYSEANQLIANLKKCPKTYEDRPEVLRYKQEAISEVAKIFESALLDKPFILCPIPPSKEINDPKYDDRMTQICKKVCESKSEVITAELIKCKKSKKASHKYDNHRPKPNELKENYDVIFPSNLNGIKNATVVLVDDVLTTGSHFRACKDLLLESGKVDNVFGLFVARRVPPDPESLF